MAYRHIRGGRALRDFIQRARQAGGVKRIEVGFFESARYPDGTPVAAVAAWNEFGAANIPERPFFRSALALAEDPIEQIIRDHIDPRTLQVDEALANQIGAYMQGEVQKSIVDLTSPANAPSTIARKGSSNPLVDTGTMRTAVTFKVSR